MRRLRPEELAAYDLIEASLARTVRVQRVPVLLPGVAAMTIGRFVLMRRDDNRSGANQLLAHELDHVRQFHELGAARFLWRYCCEYLANLRRLRRHRVAYQAIGFEREARSQAVAWAERRARRPPQ